MMDVVRFWCPWCGAVTDGARPNETVHCSRCIEEFTRLMGVPLSAPMLPLKPGQRPGRPGAARRRFVFTDARTGRLRGQTAIPQTTG
jgi:hypothetical protein